jgi:hypothetical protein
MTPHLTPLLFVATEGGLGRYLGATREFPVPASRPEYLRVGDEREHDDRSAAHGFIAGAFRLLGIGAF